MSMTIIWSALTVLFLVVEAATVGLASIWFAIGALCALIAAALGAPVWLQIIWFIVISAATLILTRPLAKKYINGKRQATNADRVIGTVCRVTEKIDNIAETGAAAADGKIWTARSADGSVIDTGALVTIKDISGVKLMVVPADESEERTD